MTSMIRIGCGAGFANDRFDAAVELVENGNLDVLVLECLAERTIALGQARELHTPGTGFDPSLERRMRSLLASVVRQRTQLVTNLGSANPLAAGRVVRDVAREMGLSIRIAVLTGDDVLGVLDPEALAWEDERPLHCHGPLVSANAYLGIDHMLPALEVDADVVVTGRVADPSLFLAPMVHRLGWESDDWEMLARGTAAGHLLECGSHVSGGYFADPPHKLVPNLAYVGFPYVEMEADGGFIVTKNPGTGGCVNIETVSEQLTYEVLDPAQYLTPDVTADFQSAHLSKCGTDRVRVEGVQGFQRPQQLKVSVGYRAGFRCEAEISYGGSGSVERANLAAEIVRTRLKQAAPQARVDIFGINALHGDVLSAGSTPYECRVRMSTICTSEEQAMLAGEEVVGLYNNGPAGGGGARSHTSEVIGVISASIPRESVTSTVTLLESE